MEHVIQDDKKAHPNAVLLRGAEYLNLPSYNCYSYALYDQSASNNVWLQQAWQFFSDGSYRKVTYPYRNAIAGDVFVYGFNAEDQYVGGPTHVALVETIIPEQGVREVISKWGCGGL